METKLILSKTKKGEIVGLSVEGKVYNMTEVFKIPEIHNIYHRIIKENYANTHKKYN